MAVEIRELGPKDAEGVLALWRETKVKVAFEHATALREFVRRHPSLSLVAQAEDKIVGAILCGRHGNTATIHHIAIAPSHNSRDLTRQLIDKALMKLLARGRHKCKIAWSEDVDEHQFWESVRWWTSDDEAVERSSSAQSDHAVNLDSTDRTQTEPVGV